MNPKKILIIVLVFFVFASGGLITYNFLKDKGESPDTQENQATEEKIDLKIKAISKGKILAPTISEDGQTIKYYLKNTGQVYASQFDGSASNPISTTNLPGLFEVIWSPDKQKVISFFGSEVSARKTFYDYLTKRSSQLNQNIKSITFSPSGQKIAYQFQASDKLTNTVSIADPDGSNWKNIFQTRMEDLVVEWPIPDKISLRNKPSGSTKGSLFIIEVESGNFSKIIGDLYGFAASWSPDGQQIIYQATDQKGKNLKLYLAAADGSLPQELPVATLAEKCVWTKTGIRIFCAVPQKLSENATWPDDYLAARLTVKDDIFLIDLTTKTKTKIAESSDQQFFDAQDLLLSPQEDYLFFVNRKDGLLYSVKLELK